MIALITLASAARLGHLRRQQEWAERWAPEVPRIVVWLDATPAPDELTASAAVVHVPPGEHGMALAAARNAGVARAVADGAELLVLLDADCIPGPQLLTRYRAAAGRHPGAVLCGPVTYLPEGAEFHTAQDLADATAPHPARPAPAPGEEIVAPPDDARLFWSLSFALTADTWQRIGGFDESYQGYGGEDTDFGFRARQTGAPLVWVGGADAYHQHHPTSSPPWQHLDDILRNGRRFADRWGVWPMEGWLEAFAAAGAIHRTAGGWARVPGWTRA